MDVVSARTWQLAVGRVMGAGNGEPGSPAPLPVPLERSSRGINRNVIWPYMVTEPSHHSRGLFAFDCARKDQAVECGGCLGGPCGGSRTPVWTQPLGPGADRLLMPGQGCCPRIWGSWRTPVSLRFLWSHPGLKQKNQLSGSGAGWRNGRRPHISGRSRNAPNTGGKAKRGVHCGHGPWEARLWAQRLPRALTEK